METVAGRHMAKLPNDLTLWVLFYINQIEVEKNDKAQCCLELKTSDFSFTINEV